ncbi:MAG: hypothetical protein A2X49_08330 [Lentisphaerae bacterium GWF2_52_8]|nr:MAG: hypothetical protein A2X49_08330 [Lentisphaerae bacterium GWF2_52_8]
MAAAKKNHINFPYCKRCKKCCCLSSGTDKITLSRHDIERLRNAKLEFKVRKDGSLYRLVMKSGRCPFLKKDGCALPEELRPLDCKTYPVHFIPDGKEDYLTVSLKCPSWNKVSPAFLKDAKELAKREFKHWTKAERIGYWV